MLTAVVAGILAALIAIGAIVVVLVMRSRAQTPGDANPNNQISQLDTVGVGGAEGAADVRVKHGERAVQRPGDSLSRRFAVLGALAAAVFAVLGSKLWSMQIMSTERYASEAEENLYTSVTTPAARGGIFDRNGIALVTNRVSQTVLADPDLDASPDVVRRLSAVLGLPVGIIRQRIADSSSGAQSRRVVESDVRLRDVAFISEHADAFPGVTVEARTVRSYPFGALAAHVLGYTGSPTEDQLSVAIEGRQVESTDVLGKSGVELSYDNVLAGDRGTRRVMVDASGNIVSVLSETASRKGSDLILGIDAKAQYVADHALADTIAPLGDIGTGLGVAGSVVAIDVRDGSVAVMANYPTFDPTNFTGGIPQEIWDVYNTEESFSPLLNRAVNGQYAAASTFKAFTSMAALHYGFADETTTWGCGGEWDGFGSGDVQKCWEERGHGYLNLSGGIVNSCDIVFYEIGKAFFDHGPEGTGELSETALQEYIEKYGFGSKTGIDLADESSGRVPTPEWKQEHWRNVPSEARWVGGDYTNMTIGQGDVLVTPMQIAVAYGAIATGKLMKPHLMKEVRNDAGDTVVTFEPEVIAEPDVDQGHLQYVRNALRNMVLANQDVDGAFLEEGVQAAGKSGTAEHSDTPDDGWFVAYAPYDDPKYVVACVIEQGTGGSKCAAPVVAKVMGALLASDAGEFEGGVGRVSASSGKSVALGYDKTGRTD